METDLRPAAPTDRLVIQTVAVPDPGDLIGQLPQPAALAWVRRGEGLVGWGEAARITLPAGEDRFTVGEKWLRSLLEGAEIDDQVGVPGSGPVAFGSFTFDPTSDGSVLVLPAAVLGRRDGRAWLTTIGPAAGQPATVGQSATVGQPTGRPSGQPPEGRVPERWVPEGQPPQGRVPVSAPGRVTWHDGSLSAGQWEDTVDAAVARIKSGGLRKVVLARDLYATAPADLDVRALLSRLAARYPDCYTFACAGLVGATPELLIRREGTQISALVLAGTIPRGTSPERDEALGAALLASVKDREEHDYAASGVRETLAPLCAQLDMDDSPFLLRLANVQHLATSVTGTLPPPRPPGPSLAGPGRAEPTPSALALAAALHPTAAVCGTPTEAAMELIRELEGMDRGRYAGPVGWLDARGNGEWGIAMRCAELEGSRARLFAGCGIVSGSQPGAEQAEAQAKFRPMQDALEGRQP